MHCGQFPSLSLSTAEVCIVHTDKDTVRPLCSDSSLNLEGELRSWEVSLITAASRRRHCISSKGGLQCPGSTHKQTSQPWVQIMYYSFIFSKHFIVKVMVSESIYTLVTQARTRGPQDYIYRHQYYLLHNGVISVLYFQAIICFFLIHINVEDILIYRKAKYSLAAAG